MTDPVESNAAVKAIITDPVLRANTSNKLTESVLQILNKANEDSETVRPLILYYYCGTVANRVNHHFRPYWDKIDPLLAQNHQYEQLDKVNSAFLNQVAIDLGENLQTRSLNLWNFKVLLGSIINRNDTQDAVGYIKVCIDTTPQSNLIERYERQILAIPPGDFGNNLTQTLVYGYDRTFEFPSYRIPNSPFQDL